MLKRLRAEGVESRHVVRDARAPTGVAVIQVDRRGEKQILTAPGANSRLSIEDVESAAATIRTARVVLFQLETPVATVVAAARMTRQAGAQVVLDPAPAVPLPDELYRMLDVIRPNAGEAQVLTGVAVSDRRSAREAALRLLERGVGAVVVQAGNGGDLLVWSEEVWLPRFPVESIDATGAGDAFAAALSVLLAEGCPLDEAARFASAAAALATTKLGAQAALPRRDAVMDLLGQAIPDHRPAGRAPA